MNLMDALKNTKKAHLGANMVWYYGVSLEGFMQILRKSDGGLIPYWCGMTLSDITRTDWLPYNPGKCVACTEADETDNLSIKEYGEKDFFKAKRVGITSGDHLRKYHCTCKEKNNE